jgi:RNA polymerase sigma-70 factor (ECF subfamily)
MTTLARAPRSEKGSAARKSPARSDPPLRLLETSAVNFPQEQYERVAPIVNNLLWTLLGPDPEREDLAHEIFVRILRNADKVRDPAHLEAWAARVAANAVKNEFRARKLRRMFMLGADTEELATYHPDFEGRELLLRTYRVLMLLPTRERLPFTLRLVDQQSAEQIALVCGSSVRTIKRRLKAARERFVRLAAADPLLAERLRKSPAEENADDNAEHGAEEDADG